MYVQYWGQFFAADVEVQQLGQYPTYPLLSSYITFKYYVTSIHILLLVYTLFCNTIVYKTLPVMFFYCLTDSTKCIVLNILRCTGRPTVTVIVNMLVCAFILLPVGYTLGIKLQYGLVGLWATMALAWLVATVCAY